MPEVLVHAAPWIAGSCALVAVVVAAWSGWHAWRRWRQLRVVQRAAVALVDVHAMRLDDAIMQAASATGELAEGGEQLAVSLAELRADVLHLRWLAGRIGDEREQLLRELADLVLPSSGRAADD